MGKMLKNSKGNDNHWISISDMMSGLMMIFLFISISYMINVVKQKDDITAEKEKIKAEKDEIDKIVKTYEEKQKKIINDLKEEFKKDEEKWGAQVDGLSIRFKYNESPEVIATKKRVLFKKGSSSIEPFFKITLDEFSPRYFDILYKYKDDIEEIRVEGHSSSEGLKDSTEDPYYYNMGLSQKRTREVLNYILNLKKLSDKKEWIKDNLTANGLSSSKLIFKEDNAEDMERSRRVEFRVKTNAEKRIMEIIEKMKKNETPGLSK